MTSIAEKPSQDLLIVQTDDVNMYIGGFGMGVTLRDVAKAANVSISTASRILNKDTRSKFSVETKERVWNSARLLGYVPNENARKLAMYSEQARFVLPSGGIGYLLNDTPDRFSDPFFARVIKGIDEALSSYGSRAEFAASCLDFGTSAELAHSLAAKGLDSLIVVGGVPDEIMSVVMENIKNVVWIGDSPLIRFEGIDIVSIDYKSAMQLALEHLAGLGHTNVGFITGETRLETGRLDAFKRFVDILGLVSDPRNIQITEFSVQGGYRGVMNLLSSGARPTAVIAASDAMAIGGIKAFSEKGIRVPEDMSVVGFDDIDVSAYVNPPLTTVRVFKEEIGKAAVKLVMERLSGQRQLPVKVILPVKFIVRESTAKCKSTCDGSGR